MTENSNIDLKDGRFVLRALAAWLCAEAIMLPTAALILLKSSAGLQETEIILWLLSFLGAAAAGLFSAAGGERGLIYKGLICAFIISLLLLTAGFLIDRAALRPEGIIRVCSFSFAGCIAGSAAAPERKGRKRNRKKKVTGDGCKSLHKEIKKISFF